MPTIRRFAACKIAIYADDHRPPHFHIEDRGFRAIVEIDTMNVRAGDVRRAEEALSWARENIALLHAEWKRLGWRRAGGSGPLDAPGRVADLPERNRRAAELLEGVKGPHPEQGLW